MAGGGKEATEAGVVRKGVVPPSQKGSAMRAMCKSEALSWALPIIMRTDKARTRPEGNLGGD